MGGGSGREILIGFFFGSDRHAEAEGTGEIDCKLCNVFFVFRKSKIVSSSEINPHARAACACGHGNPVMFQDLHSHSLCKRSSLVR